MTFVEGEPIPPEMQLPRESGAGEKPFRIIGIRARLQAMSNSHAISRARWGISPAEACFRGGRTLENLENRFFRNFRGGGHFRRDPVMTGLVPVIRVGARSARRRFAAPVRPGPVTLSPGASFLEVDVDGRDTPGHDGGGVAFDPRLGTFIFPFFPLQAIEIPRNHQRKAWRIQGKIWRFQGKVWRFQKNPWQNKEKACGRSGDVDRAAPAAPQSRMP